MVVVITNGINRGYEWVEVVELVEVADRGVVECGGEVRRVWWIEVVDVTDCNQTCGEWLRLCLTS